MECTINPELAKMWRRPEEEEVFNHQLGVAEASLFTSEENVRSIDLIPTGLDFRITPVGWVDNTPVVDVWVNRDAFRRCNRLRQARVWDRVWIFLMIISGIGGISASIVTEIKYGIDSQLPSVWLLIPVLVVLIALAREARKWSKRL